MHSEGDLGITFTARGASQLTYLLEYYTHRNFFKKSFETCSRSLKMT